MKIMTNVLIFFQTNAEQQTSEPNVTERLIPAPGPALGGAPDIGVENGSNNGATSKHIHPPTMFYRSKDLVANQIWFTYV